MLGRGLPVRLVAFAMLMACAPGMAQTGIVIQPSIEKPRHAKKLKEKDFGGYLLVYFKDQTQSAYFAISRDG